MSQDRTIDAEAPQLVDLVLRLDEMVEALLAGSVGAETVRAFLADTRAEPHFAEAWGVVDARRRGYRQHNSWRRREALRDLTRDQVRAALAPRPLEEQVLVDLHDFPGLTIEQVWAALRAMSERR